MPSLYDRAFGATVRNQLLLLPHLLIREGEDEARYDVSFSSRLFPWLVVLAASGQATSRGRSLSDRPHSAWLKLGDDPRACTLEDAVDYIVGEAHRLRLENTILVAHSWGACPATAASAALVSRISKIVYFNAYAPPPGRSVVDELDSEILDLTIHMIKASPTGVVTPTLELVESLLMPAAAPELQQMVADL